ncbi:hypothetical protein Tco_0792134 [Tanacetum coccineum]
MQPNMTEDNDYITMDKTRDKEGEDESHDIKREDLNDGAHGDTMEEEVEVESEESEEEIEEKTKEEEEDNPEYFDTFSTIEELGRVKGLKVFVGNFTYECDFILEDTTSVIDHYIGRMVLGKPFMKETRLVYDKDEGTATSERDKENITFKMPHKMKRFKHIDEDIKKTNNIPPFIITGNDGDQERTHYSNSLNLGLAYR